MAAVARRPFAPLDPARLQALTSIKNRQNGVMVAPPSGKRKADFLLEKGSLENIDPLLFTKRSKATSQDAFSKSAFEGNLDGLVFEVKAPTVRSAVQAKPPPRATRLPATPRSAHVPPSTAAKLSADFLAQTSPTLSAPAGRSPIRNKRPGLLPCRAGRVMSPPPSCHLRDDAAPFSIDAALKGTISAPTLPLQPITAQRRVPARLDLEAPLARAKEDFEIHEDTQEQHLSNMLQHSTCVLDISSDEENELKLRRAKAEGCDKENIPPPDDLSQTPSARGSLTTPGARLATDKKRAALKEMEAATFYPDHLTQRSIFIVPADDDDDDVDEYDEEEGEGGKEEEEVDDSTNSPVQESGTAIDVPLVTDQWSAAAHEDMGTLERGRLPVPSYGESLLRSSASLAAEDFDLWESGSAKDELEREL